MKLYLQVLTVLSCFIKSDERSRSHIPHHRKQRGRNSGEEHSLPDVGYRRARVSQVFLEHLLLQYRGEKFKLYCPAAIFFLSVAGGVFVQSTNGDRGRPSQRSQFHKEARLSSRAWVRASSVFKEGREKRRAGGRDRCFKGYSLQPYGFNFPKL